MEVEILVINWYGKSIFFSSTRDLIYRMRFDVTR